MRPRNLLIFLLYTDRSLQVPKVARYIIFLQSVRSRPLVALRERGRGEAKNKKNEKNQG